MAGVATAATSTWEIMSPGHARTHVWTLRQRADMHAGVCADMRAGVCADMRVGVCADMHAGVCADMRLGVCADMRVRVFAGIGVKNKPPLDSVGGIRKYGGHKGNPHPKMGGNS